jgi:hypothetical protein
MTFKDLALPMAMMGVPVARLQPKSKIPMDKSWTTLATTDVDKILAWDSETPGANCACVAKDDGVLFFETDEPGVIERYEKETGEKFKTFTVQSRKDRFHFYFTQTDESRKLGSITQKEIPFGSLRQSNAYVVAPGSIHPVTGLPYAVLDASPIIPIPPKLVVWLTAQRTKVVTANPVTSEDGPILEGGRDNTLTSIGGKLRHAGLDYAEIEAALLRINEERCKPPMSSDDVTRIARSVSRYAKDDLRPTVLIGGKPAGQTVASSYAQANTAQAQSAVEVVTAAEAEGQDVQEDLLEYPYWCWNGTLYEDFAALCGENNVVPKEYMIEAIKTVVGAICGHRIFPFEMASQESRFYTVLIGPSGIGKSSAVRWAIDLFIGTGLLYMTNQNGGFTNIGAAKCSFASQPGMVLQGFSRYSRILQVYDEVTTMIEKCGITGSGDSFLDAQNQLYESGAMPQLLTKTSKDQGPHVGQLVHNSILGCTTREKWISAFVKTNSESSGFFTRLNVITSSSEDTVANFRDPDLTALRDQFVRKIQPLEYQNVIVKKESEAADMFDKWHKSKRKEWKELPLDVTGRMQAMVERNVSHLAWLSSGNDLAPDPDNASQPIEVTCDEDIMRRAIALAEYQIGARQAHQPAPGRNDYAIVENLIKMTVKQRGAIQRSKLHRAIRADKYGIRTFENAIVNLVQEGIVKIAQKEGETKRGRKAQVIVWVND